MSRREPIPVGVDVLADRSVAPYMMRGYKDGVLKAYAVLDAWGWAIIAWVPENRLTGRGSWCRVDRYDPWPGEPSWQVRRSAVVGLHRYVQTGSAGEGMHDLRPL